MRNLRKDLAFLCLALVMLAGRAAAQELPTADALRALTAAAAGPPLDSSYEQIRFTRAGIEGTETIVRAAGDFRENDVFGPFQTAFGSYQKQAWHQNANGQTVLDEPDPGHAVADAYTTTISRVNIPFEACVIARLNGAGSGTKDFIDPATSRVVRREAVEPTETTVFTYDDFRTVDGRTRAWHWTVRDGHAENDTEYWVQALVVRPIAAADLAIPTPRRALVEFPAGKTSVDLPAQFVRDKFVVRVIINGRGLDFVLDSGAAGITIDDTVARELGLRGFAQFSNAANAGRVKQTIVSVPEMAVGELRMRDVAVRTLPALPNDLPDVKIVGLLGFDFIAELALRLDYEHGRVSASSNDLGINLKQPGTIALDVRLGTQQPLTTVVINGAIAERFAFDTGNGGGLIITDYFARRYPHALADLGTSESDRGVRLTGVGGSIDVKPYRLAQVKIGNVTFEDFVAYRVMERTSYAHDLDGFIGVNFMQYFTVWLDYANSSVVLIPNSNARAAFH